jgi:hypothetical protein
VEFDGLRVDPGGKVTLLEAKDGYAQFLESPKPTTKFPNWKVIVLDKVTRQARKAQEVGLPLEIHCAQPEVAARLTKELQRFASVKVISAGDGQ